MRPHGKTVLLKHMRHMEETEKEAYPVSTRGSIYVRTHVVHYFTIIRDCL